MVGPGVLLECLDSPAVESVLAIGRRTTGRRHPKLTEVTHRDFADFSPVETQLGKATTNIVGVPRSGVGTVPTGDCGE